MYSWLPRYAPTITNDVRSNNHVIGTGKSSAAQYLCKTSTAKITLSYFFRSVISNDLAKPTPFAAALLYDLLQDEMVKLTDGFGMAINEIMNLSISQKCVNAVPFHALWVIFQTLVNALPEVMMVFDGLDECDEATRIELSTAIIALSSLPNTRVIISFRIHPKLETLFQHAFKIELTPTSIKNDIELYVNAEIRRHPQKLEPLKKEILENVSRSAKGMFLWTVLLVDELKHAETLKAQRQCLTEVPPDLYTFYTKILRKTGSKLHSKSLRREIFLILIGLRQALRCEEISFVLSLKHETATVVDDHVALIESEEALLRVCGYLVRISDGRIHLMHETVKDYLLCHEDRSTRVDSDEAEAYLAFKCLAALSQEEYRSLNKIAMLVRENVTAAALEDKDRYFYQYAAMHWYRHLVAVSHGLYNLRLLSCWGMNLCLGQNLCIA